MRRSFADDRHCTSPEGSDHDIRLRDDVPASDAGGHRERDDARPSIPRGLAEPHVDGLSVQAADRESGTDNERRPLSLDRRGDTLAPALLLTRTEVPARQQATDSDERGDHDRPPDGGLWVAE